jgi:hypothetical protein
MGEEGKSRAAIFYNDVDANAAYFRPPSAEADRFKQASTRSG